MWDEHSSLENEDLRRGGGEAMVPMQVFFTCAENLIEAGAGRSTGKSI